MVQYKGVVANDRTLNKITTKVEDVKSYPLKDGKIEITFPFLVKVILTTKGLEEKAAYIMANGVLAIVTEEKQEIVDISFIAGEKALQIVFNE